MRPPVEKTFELCLTIGEIKQLPLAGLRQHSSSSRFGVQVEWRGSGGGGGGILPAKVSGRRCFTSRRAARPDGVVAWNEGFHHDCRLKGKDSGTFRSWIVKLIIQEFDEEEEGKTLRVGKAKVDIAQFIGGENLKLVDVPIDCKTGGGEGRQTDKPKLLVSLRFVDSHGGDRAAPARNLCVPWLSSHRFGQFDGGAGRQDAPSGRDNHIDVAGRFPKVQLESLLLAGEVGGKIVVDSKNSRRIDSDQKQLRHDHGLELQQVDGGGAWEKTRIRSRDGRMELHAEVFFASMDQRSKQAAGGSACTVLAAVVADWLLRHPGELPSRHRFDGLLRQGSSSWRKLCSDDGLRERFLDMHFDLETVLAAGVRPLSVAAETSYVGFFTPPGFAGVVDEAMSFDRVWGKVARRAAVGKPEEERVYITGWNDHFFVLKVGNDTVYLIDTLGERLYEGCKRAYILKFDRGSSICRVRRREEGTAGERMEELLYSGNGARCCKGYIKEFLAGLPLRELRYGAGREVIDDHLLHRRLQIEFHNTVPCGCIEEECHHQKKKIL